MKTLVMVGAGHSNIIAIKALASALKDQIRIILISDVVKAPYSGMLPGFMAGYFKEDQIVFDLEKMAIFYGITFIHAQMTSIHTASRAISISTGETIIYDCLSVNTGILPQNIECDVKEKNHLIYVKPLSHLIPKWTKFLEEKKQLQIAVIGAGSAGCEIATAIALRTGGKVTLITKAKKILPELPEAARRKAMSQLAKLNIQIIVKSEVRAFSGGNIILESGLTHATDYVFITTGAVPNPIPGDLKCDDSGFLVTNEALVVTGTENVFAAGDCISFNNHPLPKAGVYAVRQGGILALNIQAYFSGQAMTPYIPQKKFLKILLVGNKVALATRGNISIMGRFAWFLKVFLDRSFMNKYQP
jgi:selenide,water dikinase